MNLYFETTVSTISTLLIISLITYIVPNFLTGVHYASIAFSPLFDLLVVNVPDPLNIHYDKIP